jgi:hypothetical protein
VKFGSDFPAASRGAEKREFEVVGGKGEGRSFAVQDKASAVPHRRFGGFLNDLAAFPPSEGAKSGPPYGIAENAAGSLAWRLNVQRRVGLADLLRR